MGIDHRIDLVLRKLGRYCIKIAALQDTKWFADAEYLVGKSVVLINCWPTNTRTRGTQTEGKSVAMVITSEDMETWKTGQKAKEDEELAWESF